MCLQEIQTDLSVKCLRRLDTISKDPNLRLYVRHLTIKGFQWELRRVSEFDAYGQCVNLQEQPAVKQLEGILRQLDNCRSFEVFVASWTYFPFYNITHPDAILTFLGIITRTGLPLRSFKVNFKGDGRMDQDDILDPKLLKTSYTALAAGLEELEILHTLDFELQGLYDWPSNIIFHAPKLRKLVLGHKIEFECPAFIQNLALTSRPWSPLQELHLSYVQTSSQDFTALLQRFSQSLRILKLATFRLKASHDDLKSMLKYLYARYPSLHTIKIDALWSGPRGWDLVQFPAVMENPAVDSFQGIKIGYKLVTYEGAKRAFTVKYSGLNIDVALDILASTADLVPYI